MSISLKTVFEQIKAYSIITIGLLIYVLGWVIFIIPNNMVGGGVSGISAIIFYATKIPVSISFFVINLVLLLIALKILGKGFGVKTVYAIVVTSLFFEFAPQVISQEFIHEIAISNGKLLCALFVGVCAGLGIGICFSQGGSTGGTDIIALMIVKYRNVSPGRLILLMDIFIIASSLLLPAKDMLDTSGNIIGPETLGQRFATILYGYILIAACGYTIDLFIAGAKQSLQLFIFSKHYTEIADAIISDIGRGVTLINGQGWFTKQESKIIMVVARKSDINMIYKVIKDIDKEAFISVGSVSGV